MAGETSRRDMESFGQDLIVSGFATNDSIIGCGADEITQSRSGAPGNCRIRGDYYPFLGYMGKEAGTLVRGTDLFFPQMLNSIDGAKDIPNDGLALEHGITKAIRSISSNPDSVRFIATRREVRTSRSWPTTSRISFETPGASSRDSRRYVGDSQPKLMER